ncbi:hypothetical protein NDU88_006604 [Pleurodeles waltl]|uniref:Uncharacterized protein n=1 Tax=Pleurodeles waltl TaxID=8319 RepID=A0AAV7ULH0_PLEWA|nr:hypothetical protein NDU88_006604 [Pleurodeles waltl]
MSGIVLLGGYSRTSSGSKGAAPPHWQSPSLRLSGGTCPQCPSKSFFRGSEPQWSKRALAALRTAQPPPQMDRPRLQNDATLPSGKALSLGSESPVTGPQARACGLP